MSDDADSSGDKAPSDALVFFGATGDLAYKKIFPALQAMARRGRLELPVVGVAKSGWTLAQLVERARASVTEHGGGVDERAFALLTKRLRYVDGDYGDAATFARLKAELGDARRPLHYLAIPPSTFPTVIGQLHEAGLTEARGWSSRNPSAAISFRPARSTRRSIAPSPRSGCSASITTSARRRCRTSSTSASPTRSSSRSGTGNYVENVQITMSESFGVAGRGEFYEETGVIRDVIQNHLLQIISYLSMEAPCATYAEAIRDEQAKVLRNIRPLAAADMVRGQFRGYRDEPGVAKDSYMATYAALRLHVDSWRWQGVPFFVRAGKCLAETLTEVTVELKRAPPVVFPETPPAAGNTVRFRLSPQVSITVDALAKRPGEKMVGRAGGAHGDGGARAGRGRPPGPV